MTTGISEGNSARAGVLWALVGGVHRGVLGGLAMMGWFLLASSLLRHPAWTVPNLLSTLLDRELVLRRGFGWPSVVGLALVVLLGGLAGGAFGLLTKPVQSRRRVLLLGILVGLASYYVTNTFLYRRFGAVAWIYASPRVLLVAHLLFGAMLGWPPVEPRTAALGPPAGKT
ncbi:MAG: hypothetical protein ACP5U2_03755 [Bryobacteraceae bacterium]